MRTTFAVLVLAVLSGCAGRSDREGVSEARMYKSFIGDQRWISPERPLYLCSGPNSAEIRAKPGCRLSSKGKMTVEDARLDDKGANHLLVKLDDGSTGYVRAIDFIQSDDASDVARQRAAAAEENKKIEAKRDCDRRGGVRVGMTREQIFATCWGKPNTINKTITAGGLHEQFVYGSRNYLYLRDGVLTSIQTTE